MPQVEHPVTEWISGVNIPSCQLMIGMGVPLHRIPDIRRLFGRDARGTSTIDFDNDPQIEPSGAPPEPARQNKPENHGCNVLLLCIYQCGTGAPSHPLCNRPHGARMLLKAVSTGAACCAWACCQRKCAHGFDSSLGFSGGFPDYQEGLCLLATGTHEISHRQRCLQGTLWR